MAARGIPHIPAGPSDSDSPTWHPSSDGRPNRVDHRYHLVTLASRDTYVPACAAPHASSTIGPHTAKACRAISDLSLVNRDTGAVRAAKRLTKAQIIAEIP